MLAELVASCLYIAAETYKVPPAIMVGIMSVEGGKVGQAVKNTNGTYDLGPMQINTLWVPELAEHWKVSQAQAAVWIRYDACTNLNVAAWILRQHINETGSLAKAVGYYHSRTPRYSHRYKKKVVAALQKKGLLTEE